MVFFIYPFWMIPEWCLFNSLPKRPKSSVLMCRVLRTACSKSLRFDRSKMWISSKLSTSPAQWEDIEEVNRKWSSHTYYIMSLTKTNKHSAITIEDLWSAHHEKLPAVLLCLFRGKRNLNVRQKLILLTSKNATKPNGFPGVEDSPRCLLSLIRLGPNQSGCILYSAAKK